MRIAALLALSLWLAACEAPHSAGALRPPHPPEHGASARRTSPPRPAFTKPEVLGGRSVPASVLSRGRASYVLHCAACHGERGDGKGPAAYGLRPPPRDFRQGLFKFAAVRAGELPTDEDLLRTIRGGLRGTAMLPWKDIPAGDLAAIVPYLKTFSPRWREGAPGEPLAPTPDPWGAARKTEAIARGAKVYHALAGCAACHPAYEGRAFIESASQELLGRPASLRDGAEQPLAKDSEYGHRIVAPDFTRDPIRAGGSPPELYRTIGSGIGGTAMPTWKGSLSEPDLWALAWYVRSLADRRRHPGEPAPPERRP